MNVETPQHIENEKYGRHLGSVISKRVFLNEKFCILTQISR